MPKSRSLPKITYPTKYVEDYPGVAIPYEHLKDQSDPYHDLRSGHLMGSWEEHLQNIPVSAFDHEPFQKALDILENHFHIMCEDEVHIQHGKRLRRKGALYKSHSEFGHRPYSIFISGIMTDEDGRIHDVKFKYSIRWDEDVPRSSGQYNPRYWATFTKEEKEKAKLARWDMGGWTLVIDGTKIPHHAIKDIIHGGKGDLDEWEERDLEKLSKPLGIKGDLDWS